MNKVLVAGVVCMGVVLAGCATRASSVAPVAISSTDYTGMSCDQLRSDLRTARAREIALTKKQNNAALFDAAGVFIALVPVGSLFGADVSGELAQVKGEVLAIERSIRVKCED